MAPLRRRLDPVVTKAMDRFSVPGVAVGLLLDGEEHHLAYGVTCTEFPLPVDGHTLFQIGSTTKTYTATIATMLIEDGLLDLEAPARQYLPSFKLPDDAAAGQVLVRHLLTHTGGFFGDLFDDTGRGDDALKRIVRRMAKRTPQVTPVGEVWSYNNAGFYVLGRIIEELTKKRYEDVVKERLLDPLGMDRSFFFAEDVITHKTAIGHQAHPDGTITVARPWGLPRAVNAAGGLVSTTVDQLRYARFHLDGGTTADGTRLLPAKTVRGMQRQLAVAGTLADAVGTSWLLEGKGRDKVVKHGGSINGHMSEFVLVPGHGAAVTVLTNGSRGHELGTAVIDWFLGELGIARPKPETKPITPKVAALYAGRYQTTVGEYVVTPDDGGLLLTLEVDPKVIEAEPDLASMLPPPLPLAMTGKDRAVVQGDYSAGLRVEFVRNGGGIGFIRHGGRLAKKVGS